MNRNLKKWIGKSLLVRDGNPIVFYHGSPFKFDSFAEKIALDKPPKMQLDFGHHFTESKDMAQVYSQKLKGSKGFIYECYLKMEKPLIEGTYWREDDNTKFEELLSFAKALFSKRGQFDKFYNGNSYYGKEGKKQKEIQNVHFTANNLNVPTPKKMLATLKEFGYDGVIHQSYNPSGLRGLSWNPMSYIVLSPNKIKSIHNDGTFDVGDLNINS